MIKKLTPTKVKDYLKIKLKRIINGHENIELTTSHCGEDRILKYLFKKKKIGFYIDIGAFHPIISSNTYIFHKEGWRGINIDPFPNSMDIFKKLRPNDINLEIGIGQNDEIINYYKIGSGHHQMNGFNPNFQENLFADFNIQENDIVKIPLKVYPLKKVFEKYLPKNQKIDFMTVDVEGYEEKILISNDWIKYRPSIVMVENHKPMSDDLWNIPELKIMKQNNYSLAFKTPNELIFIDNKKNLNKSGILI